MKIFLCIALLSLAACKPPQWSNDPDKRAEYFATCMDKATLNPNTLMLEEGKIGDIVKECSDSAYYMSRRCIENCAGVHPNLVVNATRN